MEPSVLQSLEASMITAAWNSQGSFPTWPAALYEPALSLRHVSRGEHIVQPMSFVVAMSGESSRCLREM